MKSKRILCRTLSFTLSLSLLVCDLGASVISTYAAHAGVHDSTTSRQTTSAPRHRGRTYDVLHYVIRTRFDVPNKTLIGEVDVTLKPLFNGFNGFALDAANLKIEQVSLSSGNVLRSTTRLDGLHIALDHTYKPSDTITVKIKYRAHPTRGLYFISPFRGDALHRPAHIWSQGEPEDNHYWFPCYDFPDDKATSEQYITTEANELAIANGKLVDTATNSNGTRTFHWQMDKPHSSYLISMIVGDYAKLTDSYKNVSLEYYTYRGTEALAHRAFDITPEIMRWYSQVLDFDFPYDRYAQTVVGDFIFGGMENITATTFADTEILLANDNDSNSETVDLVSHELSHSWFGDLVTCKDWAHLWLNEGFATFMEASFREGHDGREAYLAELKDDAKIYFREDPSRKHHPLVNPNYPLSMDLFDDTTYKKGGFVVHMLRETVGDDMFWKALNTYLNEYKYRVVDSRDLQRVFEKVSGQSLEWFFDQWVYKAGYPELIVRSKYSPANRQLTLTVTQTQKADPITPAVFRLPIEVEIVTASGARTERIEVIRRTQVYTFQVDGKPLSVTFDKRAAVLKKLTVIPSRAVASFPVLDGADSRPGIKDAGLVNEQDMAAASAMHTTNAMGSPLVILTVPFSSSLFERFNGNRIVIRNAMPIVLIPHPLSHKS